MAKIDNSNTVDALTSLIAREGGGLHIVHNRSGVESFGSWVTANNIPIDYKPFLISIYDTELQKDIVSLVMLINPRDLNISQAQVVNSAITRAGWINTLWGSQQAVISASGLSAGFYYVSQDGKGGGLTNFYRKSSLAYQNLLAVVALFKNNAWYYMDGQESPTFFNDGTSRVINVLDVIHISYDGSDYLGNFDSFDLTDAASNPYRMEYSFEFSVSMFGSDPNTIDGHMKRGGNEKSNKIVIGIQGKNTDFSESVLMNSAEFNRDFPPEEEPELENYLRGGGEFVKYRRRSNIKDFEQKNLEKFLADNPKIDAALSIESARLNISKVHLAALINFESAGTWSTTINNPSSSALGIGQWTDGAAQNMAVILSKPPYNLISDPKVIQTSEDLVHYADTVEKQISLFSAYAQATKVSKSSTLLDAMNKAPTEQERFETLMVGHFQPSYVNKPRDMYLPANVRAVNGKIRTTQDYIDSVTYNMVRYSRRKPTISGAAAGQESAGSTSPASGGSH